jgi:DNA polymerase elongation subunit (family B)
MGKYDYIPVSNDTDSISFRKQDGSPFTEEEQKRLIEEINQIMPKMIEFEHDGYFETVVVVKAKNYVMRTHAGKVKYKGSSILDQKKEPALRELLNRLIVDLMDNDGQSVVDIYHEYIKEAANIKDISRWAVKKSVSAKVLSPVRTNEQVIFDAIKHKNPREGDKFYLYTAIEGARQKVEKGEPVFLKSGKPSMVPNYILKCVDDWDNDSYQEHYLKRVYATISILENILDLNKFIKYHNKSNQSLVSKLP